MPIYFNEGLLRAPPTFGSEYIDQRIDLVRQMKSTGDFECLVEKKGATTVRFKIDVAKRSPETTIEIDVSALDFQSQRGRGLEIQVDGYLVFYSGSGEDTYHITILEKGGPVLNSSMLSDGELLVVTPLEPGAYEVVDAGTKSKLDLIVRSYATQTRDGETVREARDRVIQEGAKHAYLEEGAFKPKLLEVIGDQPAVIHVGSKTLLSVRRKE